MKTSWQLKDRLITEGFLSVSDYASPVTLTKKKNGEYRYVLISRVLNKASAKDKFSIPHIDDLNSISS